MTGEKTMQCPNPSCQPDPLLPNVKTELVMSERSGIEIDYCPRCRGIWLDRGELDKLLEKAAAESAPVSQSRSYKKKSLLSELFDF